MKYSLAVLIAIALALAVDARPPCGAIDAKVVHAAGPRVSSPPTFTPSMGSAKVMANEYMPVSLNTVSRLAADWSNFQVESDPVLQFEWAVITQELADTLLMTAEKNCIVRLGKLPDVQSWTSTGRRTHGESAVALENDKNYHALVRATYASGKISAIAFSSAIRVEEVHVRRARDEAQAPRRHVKRDSVVPVTTIGGSDVCPIDIANRCRQAQSRVSDLLNTMYGPPQWSVELLPFRTPELEYAALAQATGFIDPNFNTPTVFPKNFVQLQNEVLAGNLIPYIDNHHHSSRDHEPGNRAWVLGIVIPIAAGVMILALLAILGLFIWRHWQSRDEEFAPRREEPAAAAYGAPLAADEEDVSYRQGRGALTTEASDRTRVEFPDTAIRRLSITHNDAEAPADDDSKSPRRKHPIMQSASSSFRDYRNVNV